jgi:hypothetical protein
MGWVYYLFIASLQHKIQKHLCVKWNRARKNEFFRCSFPSLRLDNTHVNASHVLCPVAYIYALLLTYLIDPGWEFPKFWQVLASSPSCPAQAFWHKGIIAWGMRERGGKESIPQMSEAHVVWRQKPKRLRRCPHQATHTVTENDSWIDSKKAP